MKQLVPWSAQMLRTGMDQKSMRHGMITHNLANVDTPGYRRKDVSFADELSTAQVSLQSVPLQPRHIPLKATSGIGTVYEDDRPPLRQDGNNVDVDEEMALLVSNAGEYMNYVDIHERMMRQVRTAITERLA